MLSQVMHYEYDTQMPSIEHPPHNNHLRRYVEERKLANDISYSPDSYVGHIFVTIYGQTF